MADVDYDGYDSRYDAGQGTEARRGRRWVNLTGGLVSVALLLGAGWWGYRIAMRDVMGIPVLKAAEGPARVAPDNPGGEITAYQGLSVNDVAAVGVAAPLPDEIVLAPRPVELSQQDTPGLAAEPPPELVAAAPEPPVQPLLPLPEAEAPTSANPMPEALAAMSDADLPLDPLTSVGPLGDPATDAASDAPADVLALADQLAAGAAPLTPANPDAIPSEPEAFVPAPVVPGGIGKSLLPLARPAGLAPASAAPVANAVTAALTAATAELDPATLAPGTRLVQFGAFDSADEARAQWDKLAGRFGDLMQGKSRVIQSAESGGRTFYRLRAEGFADEDDARRFCAAITAEGPDCIPVAVR
ncbi:cell division protein FtsN [Gemmobacter caeni]|uniref:Cell division protein FtsN n=1 Tax=Gemmobacter caeni TaxID=589035 RepID=A0A2T6AXV1_9RHOB|nr:SPOR domain-containing protein [Gemmobacter caeni]PTX48637.1 cell division protein FtsN [Gemmobacter caeni]TWI99562.1 cell division protein FtsN [Gemmobacter caeni]